MIFQNISIHGSKVMLCTRKRDERTNGEARVILLKGKLLKLFIKSSSFGRRAESS